jgi:hypothetical protein
MTIEFTSDEINALAKLIDAAIRAQGIEAAKAGVPLFAKLEQAVADAQKKDAE